jgi:hypothetical protein
MYPYVYPAMLLMSSPSLKVIWAAKKNINVFQGHNEMQVICLGLRELESSNSSYCVVHEIRLYLWSNNAMAPRLPPILHLLLLLTSLSYAQDLFASLDYGTFQGTYSSSYNISYWKKIPFAAPPIGENRFRAPQTPASITDGTYNSNQSFDFCPQRAVGFALSFGNRTNLAYRPTARKTASILAYFLVLGPPRSPCVQS